LPVEAQFSPVYSILAEDFDEDGKTDLLLGGNFYRSKPEVGRYDASFGLLLKGNGNGDFQPVRSKQSGVSIKGEVRDMQILNSKSKNPLLLIAKNNTYPLLLRWNNKKSGTSFALKQN